MIRIVFYISILPLTMAGALWYALRGGRYVGCGPNGTVVFYRTPAIDEEFSMLGCAAFVMCKEHAAGVFYAHCQGTKRIAFGPLYPIAELMGFI